MFTTSLEIEDVTYKLDTESLEWAGDGFWSGAETDTSRNWTPGDKGFSGVLALGKWYPEGEGGGEGEILLDRKHFQLVLLIKTGLLI